MVHVFFEWESEKTKKDKSSKILFFFFKLPAILYVPDTTQTKDGALVWMVSGINGSLFDVLSLLINAAAYESKQN